MIYFFCTKCGEQLEAPECLRGDSLECPACGIQNTVTGQNADFHPRAKAFIKKRKTLIISAAAILLLSLLLLGLLGGKININPFRSYANIGLQSDLNNILSNTGIKAKTYYSGPLTNSIVFDIYDISGQNSRADVLEVLHKFARSQAGKTYNKVILSFRGDPRFQLDGRFFNQLATSYRWRDTMYAAQHIAEHVQNCNGTAAYARPSSRMLPLVIGTQWRNSNDFHSKWYWNDLN